MTTEYIKLSDEEQKAEAIRAIVTAQHELQAIWDEKIPEFNWATDLEGLAYSRLRDGCEWLSLC